MDEGEGEGGKPANLEHYRITADNAELKWKTIHLPVAKKPSPTPEPEPEPASTPESETTRSAPAETSEEAPAEEENQGWNDEDLAAVMEDFAPPTRHWKKSEIPVRG